jgi:hypothetical protein
MTEKPVTIHYPKRNPGANEVKGVTGSNETIMAWRNVLAAH